MAASSASTLSGYGSSFDKQSLGVVLDGTNKSKFSAWDYKLTAFAKQHKLDILLSDPDEYAQSVISAREAIPRENRDDPAVNAAVVIATKVLVDLEAKEYLLASTIISNVSAPILESVRTAFSKEESFKGTLLYKFLCQRYAPSEVVVKSKKTVEGWRG